MEMKPRAADGLFHLLLLLADTPTISGGRTKMDDPKHIGLHDGEFEHKKKQTKKNLHFVFCLAHHRQSEIRQKKKKKDGEKIHSGRTVLYETY